MQDLTKIIADFQTTLASGVSIGGTTATLTSATDSDGVALPTGVYAFTVDRKNSAKEFFQCTLTGTALTVVKTLARGTGVATTGFARAHRKGAEIIISDFVALKRVINVLDGTTNLDASTPLGYDGTASITTANQIATKAYVDGVAIAGGADASTTVKGISKLSTAPASPTNPIAVGNNDNRVPTVNTSSITSGIVDALAGTSGTPSSTNKFVTNEDTRLMLTNSSLTTGEAIDGSTTPQVVCVVASDGLIYKADANLNTRVSAYGFVTTNASITTTPAVSIRGVVAGFTGLTKGATYYVSDTAGSIASTPSTTCSIPVGIAISATQLLLVIGKKIAYGTITHSSAGAGTQDVTTTIGFASSTIVLGIDITSGGSQSVNGTGTFHFFGTTRITGTLSRENANGTLNGGTLHTFVGNTLTVSGWNGNNNDVTLSMNAISATGFTTRIVNTTTGGSGGNSSASLTYIAFE